MWSDRNLEPRTAISEPEPLTRPCGHLVVTWVGVEWCTDRGERRGIRGERRGALAPAPPDEITGAGLPNYKGLCLAAKLR